MTKTSERIREAMELRKMKQVDIIERTHINKGSLSSYLSGKYEPKQNNIHLIAKALNVSEAWLMGYDVPMERRTVSDEIKDYSSLHEVDTQTFPMLGSIACGIPSFVDTKCETYVRRGRKIHADFCMEADGDSMINARINSGDIVYVKRQDIVDNGDIAVVSIDDKATLKRVYYYQDKDLLILRAENPRYRDLVYSGEELNHIRIIGKAVIFQGDVN